MAEIKDSGSRREFRDENGNLLGVRDICEGKGRCDLLPLKQIAQFLHDTVLLEIESYNETGEVLYLYNALHIFTAKRYESDAEAILELAVHFEDGAKKYAPNNWQGLPLYCFLDSGIRHYLKWLCGYEDERHDRAFMWNVFCLIHREDSERTYTLEEVKAELGIGDDTEEPKHVKTFLEVFLENNPGEIAEEVIATRCVENNYSIEVENCRGINCRACWNRPMEECTGESGED